jgi:glycosyltransferase involved in cell wall biosynthesis
MRILVENSVPYLAEGKNEVSSTGVYLFNIITNFAERYPDAEITVLTNAPVYARELARYRNVRIVVSRIRNPLLWLNFAVPFAAIRYRADVVFFGKSATSLFRIPGKRMIATIHGLIYKVMPETSSRLENIYWRLMAKIAYRVAHRVVTVSDNDRRDLTDDGCPPNKIEVVPIGLDRKYFETAADAHFLDEYDLTPSGYVLQVGGISVKKNQIFTLRIFIRDIAPLHPSLRLVFVGPVLDAAVFAELVQMAEEASIADRVIFTKGINQNTEFAKFLSILSYARVVVFPSLYEGFGIPPLEAMSRGVPVLVSDRGSLPEVYGSGHVLPLSESVWSEALVRIVSDDAARAGLVESQRHILERYRWEALVSEYQRIFRIA